MLSPNFVIVTAIAYVGLMFAIAYAADRADLKEGAYDVRTLPAPRTLADFFGGGGDEAATPIRPSVKIDPTSLFAQLAPSVKRALASTSDSCRSWRIARSQ